MGTIKLVSSKQRDANVSLTLSSVGWLEVVFLSTHTK